MGKFHQPEKAIFVCVGSKCGKRGGKEMCKELKHMLKEEGLKDEVEIIKTECTDRCKFAPILSVQPANIWLREYDEKDASSIIRLVKK
jgi:(2Fe-2S) ferredoxin